jgi:hypothetical protein
LLSREGLMRYEKQTLRGRFISSGSSQTLASPEEMVLLADWED